VFQDAGPETENDRGPRVDCKCSRSRQFVGVSRTQLTATRNRSQRHTVTRQVCRRQSVETLVCHETQLVSDMLREAKPEQRISDGSRHRN